MRVAFDLDNTLIRSDVDFPLAVARRGWLQRLLGTEPLRLGVLELADFCRQRGWEVWVYTTSYRSRFAIWRLLWVYGLRADGIVNQTAHDRHVRVRCSKHPPTFGIDVVIDDSVGVELEGQRHGFHVIRVAPNHTGWVGYVQARLLQLATSGLPNHANSPTQ